MIKEVAFIAIAVSDKERARKFYQDHRCIRSGRFRWRLRQAKETRCRVRDGENRNAGLLDGAVPRSGRKQASHP